MGSPIVILRKGAWLTRERMRLVVLALLVASLIGGMFLAITADGLNDYRGRPLGTDFSNVYAAGTYALEGRPAAPFEPSLQHARQQRLFGPATPFYGWHYPPLFLFVAAALALLPYLLALAVWQGATLLLYLASTKAVLRSVFPLATGMGGGLWLLFALGFPAVFINVGHGHNGFLTAALFGAALVTLDRRPLLAGLLFGLLAYKPQFGVLIPVVLAATGRWRAFGAAAATVVLLVVATILTFGREVWDAFFASTEFTRSVVLESGGTGFHKIQSAFSWVRMWGGPIALAYAIQGAVTLGVAIALAWLWRSDAPYPRKAAALIIGAILAAPYCLDYDLVLLAPAIAFLAAYGITHGFAAYEKTALAALWLVPLITRSVADWTAIPLAVPAMMLVLALVLRHGLPVVAARRSGFLRRAS
jgi:Glycosyltransferase family 87